MTGTTISGTITTGVDFTSPTYNPVTITSSASISSGTGVALAAMGVTNWSITSAGHITGYSAGVSVSGSGTLVNTGQIVASETGNAPGFSYNSTTKAFIPLNGGVLIDSGGVSNAASAVIAGYWEGVAIGGGNVVNAGTIQTGGKGFGVVLTSSGSVSNTTTGTISAGRYGLLALGNDATFTNQGTVSAPAAAGVDLFEAGTVSNLAGTITGGTYGIIVSGTAASSVFNQALIAGQTDTGVGLFHGGVLSNATSGVIMGGKEGINAYGTAVIGNFGSIGGGLYGIVARGVSTISNSGIVNGITSIGAVLVGRYSYVENAGSGAIIGGFDGLYSRYAAMISNSGSIEGQARSGAALFDGGALSNASTGVIAGAGYGIESRGTVGSVAITNARGGTITGGYDGVRIRNTAASVYNLGSITSFLTHQQISDPAGIDLADGGSVINSASGIIRATWKGLEFGYAGASGTVLNQGYIFAGDTLGDGAAIWIDEPGTIINASTGTIATPNFGIVAYDQTTLVNFGTINAGFEAVDFVVGSADLLVDEPGSQIIGLVTGGNAIGSTIASTLEFGSGTTQGTISGLGSQFIDFAQITIDAGAEWTFHSGNTIAAGVTLKDAGTLVLAGTALTDAGSTTIAGVGASAAYLTVTGAGAMWNGSGSIVVGYGGRGELSVLNGATVVASSLTIGVQGVLNQTGGTSDAATLAIDVNGRAGGSGSDNFTNELANSGTFFANGTVTVNTPGVTWHLGGVYGVLEIQHDSDLVLNAGLVASNQSVSFDDGTGVLTIGTLGGFAATIGNFIAGDEIILPGVSIVSSSFNASSHVLTLFGPSHVEVGTLQFGSSVTNGSDISVNGVTPCFVAGTRIATESGEVAVEGLRVGDLVRVLEGVEPVAWVGRRTVDCARHGEPRKVWPVLVSAHAFGEGRPRRDLWLSPDHAVYVDEVLIPVKYLINGRTIMQVPRGRVRYYHVELRRHCVLLAEAMTAESYLDTGDRANFANGGGAIALHAEFSSRVREAEGCAPLVVSGARLEAVRQRVDAIASKLRRRGFAMNRDRLSASSLRSSQ